MPILVLHVLHVIQKSMILIADSGSTKTNWIFLDAEGHKVKTQTTIGLNPYFVSEHQIQEVASCVVANQVNDVNRVMFYGAGCGKIKKASIIQNVLETVFPNAFDIQVEGDILGGARSTLQNAPGISCIIGTGANSCVYDGEKIINNVPSLGYLLADYGSGAVMGKDVLSMVLQRKLPVDITKEFYDFYQLDDREILDSLYNLPFVNRFLASFVPFLLQYSEVEEFAQVISQNFRKFFEYFVLPYFPENENLPITIVGSVAFHFKSFIVEEAARLHIEINQIVKNPMEGLIQYHTGVKV